MGEAIFVNNDGEIDHRSETKPSLQEMQAWVEGWIEGVRWPLKFENERVQFVVNEEGLLKQMAPNPLANKILDESGLDTGRPPGIVGPIIILKGFRV